MWFSYYKTANYTALCGLVRCGALLLAVRCGYVILQAVLVRFLRFVWFMWFGEHPCATSSMMSLHSLYILFISYSLKIQSLNVGTSDVKLCVAW